jgi:hypothetical protein
MARRDVVPSADPPLAGLAWLVPGVVRRDVVVASAGRGEWFGSLVWDAPSADAEDANHDDLICASLPWSGEERAAG